MAVKLLKHCGIVPDMFFTERSKIRKYFNQHRFNDMLPPNLLERRIRIVNSGKPSPIQAGTDPENLLFPKSTNFNKLQFFRGKGKFSRETIIAQIQRVQLRQRAKRAWNFPSEIVASQVQNE